MNFKNFIVLYVKLMLKYSLNFKLYIYIYMIKKKPIEKYKSWSTSKVCAQIRTQVEQRAWVGQLKTVMI